MSDPTALRRPERFFAERVLPCVWPGRTLRQVERLRASRRPGRRCVASYAVSLDAPSAGDPEFVTVTWAPLERLQRIRRKGYGGRDEPARGGAFLLRDEPCFVEVFPADRKVTALPAALALRALDPGPGPSRVRRVSVLRYRAHRCAVLRYDTDAGEAIGKVYSRAAVADEVRAKLAALGPAARERGFAFPRLLATAGPTELVLMEYVAGEDLGRRLDEVGSREELLRVAARTLDAFRSMPLRSGRRRSIAGDLDRLGDRARRLGSDDAGLLDEVGRLLERLGAGVAGLPVRPVEVVHGDYKPDQLLLRNGSAVIVDLDRACQGDPAIDTGNFAASLTDRTDEPSLTRRFLEVAGSGRAEHLAYAIALARRGVRALEQDLACGVAPDDRHPGRRLLRLAAEEVAGG